MKKGIKLNIRALLADDKKETMSEEQAFITALCINLGMTYSHHSFDSKDPYVCMAAPNHTNVKQIFYCKDIKEDYFLERIGSFLKQIGRVDYKYEVHRLTNPLTY